MRLLLVNESARCVGGAEVHLRQVLQALRERGHDVAFVHGDVPVPESGEARSAGPGAIAPSDVPAWSIPEFGAGEVLARVADWNPDLVYAHRLIDASVLVPLVERGPSVFFIHGYFGVCISGARCMKAPRPRPCTRRFGWACLLQYYPRHCGGWNPLTLWREFRRERRKWSLLRRFDLWLTHSEHVRDEYVRHGLPADRTRCIPFFVEPPGISRAAMATQSERERQQDPGTVRLLFLGRFDVLKGGQLLIAALPEVVRLAGRPVHLVMVGDGPARAAWMADAERVTRSTHGRARVEFPGWRTGDAKAAALASAEILVVPSVWPEPFGMTGLEAGFFGVPSVAFDVGGVRAWLTPGVNGQLASGSPPDARGLAAAIAGVVMDPASRAALGRGARARANEFARERHVEALEREFASCIGRRKTRL